MHEGGDEPLSNSSLLKALQEVQQLRDSGQQYQDSPQYKNLVSFLKAKSAAGNFEISGGSGSGPGGPLSLPVPARAFLDVAEQPGHSQVANDAQAVSRAAADYGPGQLQSQAYLEHALHSAQLKAQASDKGQPVTLQSYTLAPPESQAERSFKDQDLMPKTSKLKPQELIQQSQSFLQSAQFNAQQVRTSEEGWSDKTQQPQRHLSANVSRPSSTHGKNSQRPQSSLNLPYGSMAASSPGLQPSMCPSPQSQGQARMLENASQAPVSSHGQLASQYIPQLQAHLAVIQKAAQGGFAPQQQVSSASHLLSSAVGSSSIQETPKSNTVATSSLFHSAGTSASFLSNPEAGSTFLSFQHPGGLMAEGAVDRASNNISRPQMTAGMMSSSTPPGTLKMNVSPRSSIQAVPGTFQVPQLRQQQQEVLQPGLSSQKPGEASLQGHSQQPQLQQHSQMQHQQMLQHFQQQQQLVRSVVPSHKSSDTSFAGISQQQKLQENQQLQQQQMFQQHQQVGRPSMPPYKSSEASFPGSSQQQLQHPQLKQQQILQQLQQQVTRTSVHSHKSAEGPFTGPSQQMQQQIQQQQMIQRQLQHQQAVRPSLAPRNSSESSLPVHAQQSQQLQEHQQFQQQQIVQQQQKEQQHHQQQKLLEQQQQQNQQNQQQQVLLQQQEQQHHQQQVLLQQQEQQHHQQQVLLQQQEQQHQQQQKLLHQQQEQKLHHHQQLLQQQQLIQRQQQQQQLLQKQRQQQQLLQKQQQQQQQHQLVQKQQQQLLQKQRHQQLLSQKQQQQQIMPSVQQNLVHQEIGFTRHQLYVLRSQILAFRRIKKNEHLSDDLLQAITPQPLNSPVSHQPRAVVSQPTVPDRGPSPISGPANPQIRNPAVSEQRDDKRQSCSKQDVVPPAQDLSLRKVEESSMSQESKLFPRQEPTTSVANANVTPVPDQGDKLMLPPDVKTEQLKVVKSAKAEPVAGKSNPALTTNSPRTASADIAKQGPAKAANSLNNEKNSLVVRSHQGPLFDFPSGAKRDGGILSGAQSGEWGEPVILGYDVRVLLLEEGVRMVDRRRSEKLKTIEALLTAGSENKECFPDLLLKLRIEQRKLVLMELQARIRDEVEEQQQEIMAMGERAYRKFVRLCERQRVDLSRQVIVFQKSNREKHLKALFQWRKKLLEAQWATRDSRISRNRGVAKYHEKLLREFSKRKDEDRTKRMEALKNNDVDAYREMLRQQQTQMPGDAGERFEVLSSFLTQTEEYLQKLGGKISAVKNQQEREEAALSAAAAARAQGFSEEEVAQAATRAGEEVSRKDWSEDDDALQSSSVNRYYSLAHAVNEQIFRQPTMLRAGTLRDYQLVGLQWMLSLYNNRLNGILADEMGLGKTVQVMALIAYLMEFKGNYGPHLIIVPNAVIVNWKSELLRWLPSVSCIFYVGGKEARTKIFMQEVTAMKFNILVTTYEFIMRDRAKLSKVDWKYMIIDEAQRMKDRESRLARDLDRFRVQRRLLLTGTPLQNDLNELWSLLNLLLPDVFDSSKAFNDWFAKPFQRDAPPGQSDEDDWLETEKKVIVIHRLHQILEPFMLRRRVEDVEGSLPAKVSVVLKCKMSGFQAAIYDWVKATGTIRLDPFDEAQRVAGNNKRQIRAYAPLQNKCMELRKICNHPHLNYPPRGHMLNDNAVRLCGKLWVLDRILVKLHRTGHRVLLFSTMTRLLDILEEYLQWRRLKYRRIDGTTTLDAREASIVEFNRPGSEIFIFLLSIRAAGRGLNLQSADTVVIYDPDPNPKNEEQAVARAHRIGQKREVRVIYMEAVVETFSSYQKEDEIRSGGTVDSDDEMAGKDRYMGSVESLVRNNIQQHKIDMADEVINAGRFDQRTSQEERRLTLEALLHDEERYQETVHDVPTLQEVNRMIARTDEELELFDQMDEEENWPGELIKHQEVSKWLRVGSQDVNAAIAATSKQALKQGLIGAVGTKEAEERLLVKAAKAKALSLKRKSESDEEEALFGYPKGTKKQKSKKLGVEVGSVTELSRVDYVGEAKEAVVTKEDLASLEEEEDGEIAEGRDSGPNLSTVVELEEGEVEEGQMENDSIAGEIIGVENDHEHSSSPPSSDDGEETMRSVLPIDSNRSVQNGQARRFGSLAAIEGRQSTHEEVEDLEEGEIAVSGDESQGNRKSESWPLEREDVEEEQVTQPPQRKRKRSNRHRKLSHVVETSDRSNSGVVGMNTTFPFGAQYSRPGPRQVQRATDVVDMPYERPFQWALPGNIGPLLPPSTSVRPFENLVNSPQGPRIVFKHNWVNGFQEPVEDVRLAHANMMAHAALAHSNLLAHTNAVAHSNALASWNATTRMPESQQKKCKAVLGKLQGAVNREGRTIAALFMELPKRNELPDYYKVITKPIDARIIEHRLDHFEYPGVLDFAADVQLMLDNAVRYNQTSEVQADARRLQALFFQRMSLQFPDVDFSPVRTKIMAVARQPSPVSVPGSHKMESYESSEPPRSKSETVAPTTRWRSTRTAAQEMSESADGAIKEKSLHKDKRKGKDVKKNEKLALDDKVDESRMGGGILHPVDLVVLKKKRNGRERVASKLPRSRLFSVSQIGEEYREPSGNVSSAGLVSNRRTSLPPQRVPAESQGGNEKSGLPGSTKVGKRTSKPKLKVSWIDGSQRRPGQT
ncbi:unnamed protein product [Calypogeia fissa]